jgi:Na+/H+-dicarboxylate symporter
MTLWEALLVFCFWTVMACAVGVIVGRLIKFGAAPERPYDQEQDAEIIDFARACERRHRGHARNGIA